ncbi:hypothetical protein OEZ86_004012 [Tetradesmus obliquus]|nr:hypothetical protein OEZ86_004012 [Tetradesmus obliquus]
MCLTVSTGLPQDQDTGISAAAAAAAAAAAVAAEGSRSCADHTISNGCSSCGLAIVKQQQPRAKQGHWNLCLTMQQSTASH